MADEPFKGWLLPQEEPHEVPAGGWSLPEQEQRAPRKTPAGPLTASPQDTAGRAIAKGSATALLQGLAHIPGFLGDIGEFADYATTGIGSLFSNKTQAELYKELEKERAGGGLPSVQSIFPSGEEIYRKYIAPAVGEYKSESALGKSLMGAVETATSLIGPGGVLGAATRAAERAPTAAVRAATRRAELLKGFGTGALAGGLGTAATELTGSPELGLVAGLGIPTAAAIHSYRTDPTRLARKEFVGAMETPKETTAQILAGGRPSPIGAERTTPMIVDDNGLARLQHDLSSSQRATSEFQNELSLINQNRNNAVIEVLKQSAYPDADPMAIQLAMINERDNLMTQLKQAENLVPKNVDPITAAQDVRRNIEKVWDEYSGRTAELYKNVDPNKSASTITEELHKVAEDIRSSHKPDIHAPMDPALETILGMIERQPEQLPFHDVVDFDKTIERFRRAAAMRPEGGLAASQLGTLKDAINNDMANRTIGFSGNTNPAQALRAAKDHYIAGKNIFENQYTGGALRQRTYGDYVTSDKSAARAVFPSGPTGSHALEAWLNAAGTDPVTRSGVLDGIETIATAALGDKELTPQIIENWKRNYGPALSVLERERPGFLSKFDNLSSARTAINDLQDGVAGTILKVSDPSQISAEMGRMLTNKRAGPGQWTDLLNRIPDPTARAQAEQGLRRAGANFMQSAFHDPDLGTISGAKMRSFLNSNEANLRGLYGSEFDNLKKISEELARAQQVFEVGKAPVGSNTGYNTRAQVQRRMMENPTIFSAVVASGAGHFLFPGLGAAIGPALWIFERMKNQSTAQRQAVVDQLVRDAVLYPEKARVLLSKPTMENSKIILPYLTASDIALEQEKANQQWTDPSTALDKAGSGYLPKLIGNIGQLNPFARGGAAKGIDHGAEADKLIALADKAKKAHNSTTEPLLDQPDEMITKALAIADKAI